MVRTWAARAAMAVAFIVLGILLGHWLQDTPAKGLESPAKAVVQADGSMVLERATTAPETRPAHQLPTGAKLERVVQAKVKPKAPPVRTTDGKYESAPVTVDMSLVRMPDATRRVVVSSPDGEIMGGIDIPVEPFTIPVTRKWAAGMYLNPQNTQERGVFLDRDIGRVRVGAELGQHARGGLEARVKIGMTF